MFLEYKVRSEYLFPLSADNLFCDLTPETQKSFNRIKQTKRFKKSACFFTAGEVPSGVYILRRGRAQILFHDELNIIKTARLIEPNEILGLTEILTDVPYETNARTITACRCEYFGRDDFISFLHGAPEVCFQLLQSLASTLQKSYKHLFSPIN